MAYGCPVIVHEANAKGIPELTHKQNCILYGENENVIEVAVRTARNKGLLSQLASGGLATFETFFKAEVSMERVIKSGVIDA